MFIIFSFKLIAVAAPPPDLSRKVFGIPLNQAVALSRIHDLLELPAVIYRGIEYLEHRNGNLKFSASVRN